MQLLKKGHGKPGEMAEKAAEVLMGCFRVCAGDRYVCTSDVYVSCSLSEILSFFARSVTSVLCCC